MKLLFKSVFLSIGILFFYAIILIIPFFVEFLINSTLTTESLTEKIVNIVFLIISIFGFYVVAYHLRVITVNLSDDAKRFLIEFLTNNQ